MRKHLFLLIFLCLSPWGGQVRAADSLGRLFLVPEQRAQLEIVRAQRDRRIAPVIEDAPVVAAPPRPSVPPVVTYSGIVNRSDGRSTVWINGQPVHERERVKGADEVNITGVRDGVVSVAIPQVDRRASLRVGQSLDVESGVIEESYRRRVTVPRAPTIAPIVSAPLPTAADSTQPNAAGKPSPPPASVATTPSASRPVRESDTKDADPESGAAPAVPRGTQK